MAERSIASSEFGKAMQFIEQGLSIDPDHVELLTLEAAAKKGLAALAANQKTQDAENLQQSVEMEEAGRYYAQASHVHDILLANIEVYGSNSALAGATPANIGLGLQYIDRCLDLFPDNPTFLTLKGLLLYDGLGNKDAALPFLEKAAELAPRDITIQNNLQNAKSSSCFIATAAYGTPFAAEVDILRQWRDDTLLPSFVGRCLVHLYYRTSPPLARVIEPRPTLRWIVRCLLAPIVRLIVWRR